MVLSRSSGKSYKQQIVNYSTTYNFDLMRNPTNSYFGADGETRTRTA